MACQRFFRAARQYNGAQIGTRVGAMLGLGASFVACTGIIYANLNERLAPPLDSSTALYMMCSMVMSSAMLGLAGWLVGTQVDCCIENCTPIIPNANNRLHDERKAIFDKEQKLRDDLNNYQAIAPEYIELEIGEAIPRKASIGSVASNDSDGFVEIKATGGGAAASAPEKKKATSNRPDHFAAFLVPYKDGIPIQRPATPAAAASSDSDSDTSNDDDFYECKIYSKIPARAAMPAGYDAHANKEITRLSLFQGVFHGEHEIDKNMKDGLSSSSSSGESTPKVPGINCGSPDECADPFEIVDSGKRYIDHRAKNGM